MFAEVRPNSHIAEPNRAEHLAEFLGQASVFAKLQPIANDWSVSISFRFHVFFSPFLLKFSLAKSLLLYCGNLQTLYICT